MIDRMVPPRHITSLSKDQDILQREPTSDRDLISSFLHRGWLRSEYKSAELLFARQKPWTDGPTPANQNSHNGYAGIPERHFCVTQDRPKVLKKATWGFTVMHPSAVQRQPHTQPLWIRRVDT